MAEPAIEKKLRGHLREGVVAAPEPVMVDGIFTAAALAELEALVKFRCVLAKPHADQPEYVLYNYTSAQQAFGTWTPVSTLCRGLVLHHSAEEGVVRVVARPLRKFFNLGEHAITLPPGTPYTVLDKVDGSLGVVFHVAALGGWVVNTRGSWVSPQAVQAKTMLEALRVSVLDTACTYCFEIVYPDNRVVVNYGDRHDLTLLYAADTKTGAELPYSELAPLADALGCAAVAMHGAGVVGAGETDHVKLRTAVMAGFGKAGLKGNDAEGFVLVGSMPDGTLLRAKIKYDAYLLLHRAFSGHLTVMTVWQAAVSESITDLLDTLPDECYPSVHAVYTRLAERVAGVKERAAEVLKALPADASPRDASIAIKAAGSLGPLLFAARSHGWDSPVVEERAWKVVKPDKATVIVMRMMGDGAKAGLAAAGEETEEAEEAGDV